MTTDGSTARTQSDADRLAGRLADVSYDVGRVVRDAESSMDALLKRHFTRGTGDSAMTEVFKIIRRRKKIDLPQLETHLHSSSSTAETTALQGIQESLLAYRDLFVRLSEASSRTDRCIEKQVLVAAHGRAFLQGSLRYSFRHLSGVRSDSTVIPLGHYLGWVRLNHEGLVTDGGLTRANEWLQATLEALRRNTKLTTEPLPRPGPHVSRNRVPFAMARLRARAKARPAR